ncbi:hypothetical protein [Planctomicrobium sp. SH527]|uniref:hypothetical protein n=1 Tax=Planctomicrobium sp. SH527 TaxID=3448123 RepID=UPI003F5C04EB
MRMSSNFLLLIAGSLLLVGYWPTATPAAAPVRLAMPVIVNQHVNSGWFIPTELGLEIRNDCPSGTVHVEVSSVQDIGGHSPFGEYGAEKVLQEIFPRSLEQEPVHHQNIVRTQHAVENALFQANVTRLFTNLIPQYRPSLFSNKQLKTEVTGISVSSPPLYACGCLCLVSNPTLRRTS